MRIFIICLLAALLLALPAQAGKPQPQLVLTPSPITPYNTYYVTGCRYPHSATFTLELRDSWHTYSYGLQALSDAQGCLTSPVIGQGDIWLQAGAVGTSQNIKIWYGGKLLAEATQVVV